MGQALLERRGGGRPLRERWATRPPASTLSEADSAKAAHRPGARQPGDRLRTSTDPGEADRPWSAGGDSSREVSPPTRGGDPPVVAAKRRDRGPPGAPRGPARARRPAHRLPAVPGQPAL